MYDFKPLKNYIFVPLLHNNDYLKLSQIGYHNFKSIEPFRFFRCQEYHTIHFIIQGEGTLRIGEKSCYQLKENDVFFLPPDVPFKCVPNPKNKWAYVWCALTGDMEEYFKNQNFTLEAPIYTMKNSEGLKTFAYNFLTKSNPLTTTENEGFSFFYRFMAYIEQDRNNSIHLNTSETYVTKAKFLLKRNFGNPELKIEDIAKHLYISHAHLCLLFKKSTGISPKEYLIDLRNNKAKELLLDMTYTVTDVAYLVGYDNPFYFSTAFKKSFGITPSRYREEYEKSKAQQ